MTLAAATRPNSGLTLTQAPVSDALRAALRAAELPVDDLNEPGRLWFAARRDGRMIGHVGLEPYGQAALLRSVVLVPGERGRGWGRMLVDAICAEATQRGVATLYLLTTSSEPFFARLGFVRIDRADVPPDVASSRQFATLCPETAVVMRKTLNT
jgi:N-acetylglutamate synthase-like GNAT family acetyltransferase